MQRVGVLEALHFQGMANGVGVEAKGLGDGTDFPVPILGSTPCPAAGDGPIVTAQTTGVRCGRKQRDPGEGEEPVGGFRPGVHVDRAEPIAAVVREAQNTTVDPVVQHAVNEFVHRYAPVDRNADRAADLLDAAVNANPLY